MTFSQEENVNPISPLLQTVKITENEWNTVPECPTKYANQETIFTHDFIQKQIDKYNLTLDRCDKCSTIIGHFVNPKLLIDHLALDKITWVKFPNSILKHPMPQFSVPLWDPKISIFS